MKIALTFDDGPDLTVMPKILKTMEKNGARCSFFCTGEKIGKKTQAVLKKAFKIGCELGNHGYSHTCFTDISEEEIKNEITRTTERIVEFAGVKPRLVRVPYGAVNEKVKRCVPYPLTDWTLDTSDWDERVSHKSITEAVKAQVKDGDVVLMHVLYEHTAEAVETLVPYLISAGYELVTVSELFAYLGKENENRENIKD